MLLLEVPDAVDHLPAFQVASYLLLGEDLTFTVEQFQRLAEHLDYSRMSMIVQRLSKNPDWSEFRNDSSFSLPTTHSELQSRLSQGKLKDIEPFEFDPWDFVDLDEIISSSDLSSSIVNLLSDFDSGRISLDSNEECGPSSLTDDSVKIDQNQHPIKLTKLKRKSPSTKLRSKKRAIEHQEVLKQLREDPKFNNGDFTHGEELGKYKIKIPCSKIPFKEDFDPYKAISCLSDAEVFDTVIYAPPCSGKSTYNSICGYKFYDTDYLENWTTMFPNRVITNMHCLIKNAKTSVAIIPTRATFEARCANRGLTPLTSWYDDILESAQHATIRIETDDYLGEVYHPALLIPGSGFLHHRGIT